MLNVEVRVHEDFDLGGGYALTQGIHSIPLSELPNYEQAILDGILFFPLQIKDLDSLNQQLNEQIFNLYLSDLEPPFNVDTPTENDILIYDGDAFINAQLDSLDINDFGGVLDVGKGGTGETTANDALNAFLPSQSGQDNKFLQTVLGNTLWTAIPPATPAGSNTEIQFNNLGAFGASSKFKFDGNKAIISPDDAETGLRVAYNNTPTAGALFEITKTPSNPFVPSSGKLFQFRDNNAFRMVAVGADYAFVDQQLSFGGSEFYWGFGTTYANLPVYIKLPLVIGNTYAAGNQNINLSGNGVSYRGYTAGFGDYPYYAVHYFTTDTAISGADERLAAFANQGAVKSFFSKDGFLGIGLGNNQASALLHARSSTSVQHLLEYDGANSLEISVNSVGKTIFDALGTSPLFEFTNANVIARIEPKVRTNTTTSKISPDADSYDIEILTAQDQNLTVDNPTGTPVEGQILTFRITSSGIGVDIINWDTQFVGTTANPLPATTASGGITSIMKFEHCTGVWVLMNYQEF